MVEPPAFAVGGFAESTGPVAPAESLPTERNKLIFDDVYAAFQGVLEHIRPEQKNAQSIEMCWRQVVYFVIEKRGYGPDQDINKYSELRQALREKLALDHRAMALGAAASLSAKVVRDIKERGGSRRMHGRISS